MTSTPDRRWAAVAIALSAVVACLLAYIALRAPGGSAGAATDADRDESRDPPARTRPALGARPSGSSQPAMNGALPPEVAAKVAALVQDRQAAQTRARELNQRIRDDFARQFRGERADAGWAADKQQALDRVAAQVEAATGDAPATLESECRKTMCRTTARFADRGQAEQWVALYMASMGSTSRRSAVNVSDEVDGVRVEIYSLAI